MNMLNGLEEYELNMFEYAHLCEPSHANNSTYKVYIPKVMATFPFGSPQQQRWIFNNNVFVNDDNCKPSVGKEVTTQNYVTTGRLFDRNFWHRADRNGIMGKGTKFILQIMDGNIRDRRIADIV